MTFYTRMKFLDSDNIAEHYGWTVLVKTPFYWLISHFHEILLAIPEIYDSKKAIIFTFNISCCRDLYKIF